MLTQTLLGRRALLAMTLLMSYGGGLWLHVLHEVEGATETGAPPGVIHWLRDSSLSLPLVAFGVFLGAALARRLIERYGGSASELVVGGLVAVVLALYASVMLSVGNPLHGLLFDSVAHGGHDLPLGVHIVRDGLLALAANELLALSVAGVVLGYRWLLASRSLASQPASATS
jgi:hypothetical protein